ncbi:MAG: 23S rRNA (guanosine(2251)-2'-O)-methyltransferase RlmB [Metamycoplasmataceae bacterium]
MVKLLCGKNTVLEAIENKMDIKTIYLLKEQKDIDTKIKIEIISKEKMNELTPLNHQGYVAILNTFKYYDLETIFDDKPKIVLMLDHLEDPQNFGSILRTANASGIKHIIIPNVRSVDINDTVFKVSSGGIVGMKIIKVNSLQATVVKLKKKMFWIYATSLNLGTAEYTEISYNFPLVLIVGNEGRGVSKSLLKESDQNIFLKMDGTVQSLNVSVATGIILFHLKNKKEE